MDAEHLEAAIESLEAELESRRLHLQQARSKIVHSQNEYMRVQDRFDEIDQAISTVRSLINGSDEPPKTTSDYVRFVLRQAGQELKDRDILNALEQSGWTTKSNDPLSNLRSF